MCSLKDRIGQVGVCTRIRGVSTRTLGVSTLNHTREVSTRTLENSYLSNSGALVCYDILTINNVKGFT